MRKKQNSVSNKTLSLVLSMKAETKLARFTIILVEPQNSGNIGAVARAMMNFECERLILVNPCPLDDVCYARAMHAGKILDNAKTCSSFTAAIADIDFCVATSSVESLNEKRHLRNAVTVEEFSKKIGDVHGSIGLIFGREDDGLHNEEIAVCDLLLKIPTSDQYLSLNLSHAVCVVLYSLYQTYAEQRNPRQLSHVEKEKLFEFFSLLLDTINYPEHKKENTKIMFRRIMGRAMPSQWEYHTLMGVLSDALQHSSITKKKKR